MLWINAMLAFSLAMVVLCTMVSAVTELVQRIWRMRSTGLEVMLRRLFDRAIWPHVQQAMQAQNLTQDAARTALLKALMENRAVDPGRRTFKTLDSLTTTQFLERLADTEIGRQLKVAGDAVLTDLARRFERVGDDATVFFARRASLLSGIAALLLAVVLNIDAIRLFSSFLTNEELARQMVAQKDAVARMVAPAAEPAAPPSVEELEKRAADIGDKLSFSTALGLPIGASYFPYCFLLLDDAERGKIDPACKTDFSWPRLGIWLLSVGLAGLLMGLGGPFWFNTFSKLGEGVELLRGIGLLGAREKQASATGASTQPAVPPPTPVQTFNAVVPPK